MNEASKKVVLEAVKTAIITELRGLEIYRAAAEKAEDPAARQMFQSLADDELQHKRFLEQNYESLLKDGTWAVPATPENLNPLDHSEIITDDFLSRVRGGAFEMGVVATGVLLEKTAIDYYTKMSKECPDAESAKVFEFLATWEEDHLKSLQDLEVRLRDQYFADQGFAPF